MTYEYTSQPPSEPITLTEVKDYLKIEHEAEDTLLEALISSARSIVESYLNRTMIGRKMVVIFSELKDSYCFPVLPIKAITKVSYYADGELVDMDSSHYKERNQKGEIKFMSYPSDIDSDSDIHIELISGVSDPEDIEKAIKQAIMLIIVDNYHQRSDGIKTLTTASEKILNPHRHIVHY